MFSKVRLLSSFHRPLCVGRGEHVRWGGRGWPHCGLEDRRIMIMFPPPLSGAAQVGDAWGAAQVQGSFAGADKGELGGPPLAPH